MKLVHFSDTHLGFGTYSRIDPAEGINQREADIYSAFKQAVDKIVDLRPDLVVHAGDLFDTARPQNRAITFALDQLIRLSEAGIETVLISGNHSTPRLRETGSIFSIFEHLDHIHPVFEPGIERMVLGDVAVTAIPHSASPPLSQLVPTAKPAGDSPINVLVLHAGLLGAGDFRMDEFNEQMVPIEALSDGFDYVAMGHFHKHEKVRKGVYYSGSTERLGFGEAAQEKGFLEVDLPSGDVKFHALETREMVELPPVDASSLSSSEILGAVRDRVSSQDVDDKVVRLIVRKVSSEAYRSLDLPSIRRLGSSALHFELRIDRLESEKDKALGSAQIGSLGVEFQRYVSSLDIPDEKKRRLMEIGPPYLAEAEE
ncbi:MAG: hypothetical protein A3K67_01890 [Euryarchaeota archaeon RBG_16_62_10]|nr:MAG: hypothetical protein A3K67_01890 [Euryarchaeota archaeon RBG_16_62_10]